MKYNTVSKSTSKIRDEIEIISIEDKDHGIYIIKHGTTYVRALSSGTYKVGDTAKASDFMFESFGSLGRDEIYKFLESHGNIVLKTTKSSPEDSESSEEQKDSLLIGGEHYLIFHTEVEPFARQLIGAFVFELGKCMEILPANKMRGPIFEPIISNTQDVEWWMVDSLFYCGQIYQLLRTKYSSEYATLSGFKKIENPPENHKRGPSDWTPHIEERAEFHIQRKLGLSPDATLNVSSIARQIVDHFKDNRVENDDGQALDSPKKSSVDEKVKAYILKNYPKNHSSNKRL